MNLNEINFKKIMPKHIISKNHDKEKSCEQLEKKEDIQRNNDSSYHRFFIRKYVKLIYYRQK